MRKLLIRSCLIAGLAWTSSCASNKETAPQDSTQPARTLGARSGATGDSSRG